MATKTIIKAKDYKTRDDLENYVRNTTGLTPDPKLDVVISGKREELEKLRLNDTSIFWGIPCKITDSPTEHKEENKADRGKRTKFGINNQDNEI